MNYDDWRGAGSPKYEIQKFIDLAYADGIVKRNYEECAYSIYFALKHDMKVNNLDSYKVAGTNDCIGGSYDGLMIN